MCDTEAILMEEWNHAGWGWADGSPTTEELITAEYVAMEEAGLL